MSLQLVDYNESLKDSLFEFTLGCFADIGKSFEPEGRHYFYQHITEEFELFCCLVDDGTVKGSVAIKRISEDVCELKALYLSDDLRGQGWGYKLLDRAVNFARNAGYKRVVLDSMSKYEDARHLYDRYGFVPTERYNDNIYADVFMELTL